MFVNSESFFVIVCTVAYVFVIFFFGVCVRERKSFEKKRNKIK